MREKVDLDQCLADIQHLRETSQPDAQVGLVSGNFNVVHPGHLRLLKFAADCCDILVVALQSDRADGVLVPAHLRAESVSSISFVDYSFVFEGSIKDIIKSLRPSIVVKGKEHQEKYNEEEDILNEIGGKLIFSSGEAIFSSIDLISEESIRPQKTKYDLKVPENYLKRHNIGKKRLHKILDEISSKKVVVIGDIIVDEYINCDVLGLSQEDPTIVVTPILEQRFVGGAGIVASHARGLGADASFVSAGGEDEIAEYAETVLDEYGVKVSLAGDASRPTTLKRRYRSAGKTLLRVSHVKQHAISGELQQKLYCRIEDQIGDIDLLVFSDFNYGILPQALVDRLCDLCMRHSVPMVADSQSSSQVGNIARFRNMRLLTPTEKEARIALQENDEGLVALSEMLIRRTAAEHVLLTLGAEGVIVQNQVSADEKWPTDRIPALCNAPKDPAGAGDAMLVSTSLALICGASIWEAAFIGSIAAGCQVSRVGNVPMSLDEIRGEIEVLPAI